MSFTIVQESGGVAVVPQGPPMLVNGTLSDATQIGTLTNVADPAFLLVGAAAGNAARKLTPTAWGLSNLLATVPAGRVPYADATGLVTSNAGLTFGASTGLTVRSGVYAGKDQQTGFYNGVWLDGAALNPNLANYALLEVGSGTLLNSQSGRTTEFRIGNSTVVSVASTGATVTGTMTLGNGAENSPSLNLGDPTTGFWRASSQSIGMTHQGIASNVFFSDQQRLRSTNRFGWASGSAVLTTIDTELTRSSAGFVGLGSPTNKVVIGHNGTDGSVTSPLGTLRLLGTAGNGAVVGSVTANDNLAVGGGGVVMGTAINNLTFGSTGDIRAGGFGAFTITNPTLRWPSNSPDTRLRRSSANVLDLDTGTDGAFGDLRLRNLSAAGGATFSGNVAIDRGGALGSLSLSSTSCSGTLATNHGNSLVSFDGVSQSVGGRMYFAANATTNVPRPGVGLGGTAAGVDTTLGFLGANSGGGVIINVSNNTLNPGLRVTFNHGSPILLLDTAGNLTASGNGTFSGLTTFPAGLGVGSSLTLFGLNGTSNSGWGQVAYFDANGLRFTTGANGTGTVRGMEFSPGGTLNLRMGVNTVGFYGVTPVARPTLPDAGTVTAADIRTALISLGLCQ